MYFELFMRKCVDGRRDVRLGKSFGGGGFMIGGLWKVLFMVLIIPVAMKAMKF
jgi:hypothetical protein